MDAENRVYLILLAAATYAHKTPGVSLGDALRGHMELTTADIQSLITLAHAEIEDAYYEDAPNQETQNFLDHLKAVRELYPRFH